MHPAGWSILRSGRKSVGFGFAVCLWNEHGILSYPIPRPRSTSSFGPGVRQESIRAEGTGCRVSFLEEASSWEIGLTYIH